MNNQDLNNKNSEYKSIDKLSALYDEGIKNKDKMFTVEI